jgi:peptidoglycan/LPS O-acetylase OafA/YrhL
VTQNSRVDEAPGELSYPIYIGHMLFLALIKNVPMFFAIQRTWAWVALNLIFVIAVAAALNLLIAERVERVRVRFGARRRDKPM